MAAQDEKNNVSEERSAEAGAKQFPGWDSRQFIYYKPKGRKATLYEDVTVDVQLDPARYLLQGWILSFADGTPAYSEKRTVMRSSDWHAFRAPDQEWERPHYQRQSVIEKMLQMTIENARANGSIAHFDKTWIRVLQDHVGASKHAEHGIGMALMFAQRDGMTQMINNTLLTNASYKLRYAQDLTLYLAEAAMDLNDFDEGAGKRHWLEDPLWQGAREAIERILAAPDHLEKYFACNLLYEPLVAELFRSGFVMQLAALQGDFVTPTVVSTAESDYERNLMNTIDLFHLLAFDEQYGDQNRAHMQEWVERYAPLCVQAARLLQPIWSLPRVKMVRFDDAFQRAQQRMLANFQQLGLVMPKEVQA